LLLVILFHKCIKIVKSWIDAIIALVNHIQTQTTTNQNSVNALSQTISQMQQTISQIQQTIDVHSNNDGALDADPSEIDGGSNHSTQDIVSEINNDDMVGSRVCSHEKSLNVIDYYKMFEISDRLSFNTIRQIQEFEFGCHVYLFCLFEDGFILYKTQNTNDNFQICFQQQLPDCSVFYLNTDQNQIYIAGNDGNLSIYSYNDVENNGIVLLNMVQIVTDQSNNHVSSIHYIEYNEKNILVFAVSNDSVDNGVKLMDITDVLNPSVLYKSSEDLNSPIYNAHAVRSCVINNDLVVFSTEFASTNIYVHKMSPSSNLIYEQTINANIVGGDLEIYSNVSLFFLSTTTNAIEIFNTSSMNSIGQTTTLLETLKYNGVSMYVYDDLYLYLVGNNQENSNKSLIKIIGYNYPNTPPISIKNVTESTSVNLNAQAGYINKQYFPYVFEPNSSITYPYKKSKPLNYVSNNDLQTTGFRNDIVNFSNVGYHVALRTPSQKTFYVGIPDAFDEFQTNSPLKRIYSSFEAFCQDNESSIEHNIVVLCSNIIVSVDGFINIPPYLRIDGQNRYKMSFVNNTILSVNNPLGDTYTRIENCDIEFVYSDSSKIKPLFSPFSFDHEFFIRYCNITYISTIDQNYEWTLGGKVKIQHCNIRNIYFLIFSLYFLLEHNYIQMQVRTSSDFFYFYVRQGDSYIKNNTLFCNVNLEQNGNAANLFRVTANAGTRISLHSSENLYYFSVGGSNSFVYRIIEIINSIRSAITLINDQYSNLESSSTPLTTFSNVESAQNHNYIVKDCFLRNINGIENGVPSSSISNTFIN